MEFKSNPLNKTVFYHRVDKYENGYGASIICHDRSYGGRSLLFEVAILRGDDIVYDTGLAEDVLGSMDFCDVAEVLEKIKKLPKVDG